MQIQIEKLQSASSIHAQLVKVSPTRGVMIATCWVSNTVTIVDAFGNCKTYEHDSVESMRNAYKLLLTKGYTLVSSRK